MASSTYKVVVLGGGNAAGYFASAWLDGGGAGADLCIITDEQVVAYERPALSKAYLFPQGAARLPGFHTTVGSGGERHEASWYAERGITYLTGSRVVAADVAAKGLSLASGDLLAWSQALVVATGADAVRLSDFGVPGAELGGVHYLRNVADADGLVAGIAAAKAAGGKAVVVGGGYIGLEVSAGLCLNGLDVAVVFPEQHLLSRILNAQLAQFYEAYYEAKGIRLVRGQLAKGFEGTDGKVASVLLSDGSSLPADLVVVGAGARPASALFVGQLELDKAGGITVDAHFQASVAGVYAIGDVASFPLARAGGQRGRQEHVTHARASAAHAAAVLLGAAPAPYDYLPYFYSREFALSWQFWGSSEGADSCVVWGAADGAAAAAAAAPGGPAAKFGAFWLQGGRLEGAFLEGGSADEAAALKALVAARAAAPGADELRTAGASWALAAAAKL